MIHITDEEFEELAKSPLTKERLLKISRLVSGRNVENSFVREIIPVLISEILKLRGE